MTRKNKWSYARLPINLEKSLEEIAEDFPKRYAFDASRQLYPRLDGNDLLACDTQFEFPDTKIEDWNMIDIWCRYEELQPVLTFNSLNEISSVISKIDSAKFKMYVSVVIGGFVLTVLGGNEPSVSIVFKSKFSEASSESVLKFWNQILDESKVFSKFFCRPLDPIGKSGLPLPALLVEESSEVAGYFGSLSRKWRGIQLKPDNNDNDQLQGELARMFEAPSQFDVELMTIAFACPQGSAVNYFGSFEQSPARLKVSIPDASYKEDFRLDSVLELPFPADGYWRFPISQHYYDTDDRSEVLQVNLVITPETRFFELAGEGESIDSFVEIHGVGDEVEVWQKDPLLRWGLIKETSAN